MEKIRAESESAGLDTRIKEQIATMNKEGIKQSKLETIRKQLENKIDLSRLSQEEQKVLINDIAIRENEYNLGLKQKYGRSTQSKDMPGNMVEWLIEVLTSYAPQPYNDISTGARKAGMIGGAAPGRKK